MYIGHVYWFLLWYSYNVGRFLCATTINTRSVSWFQFMKWIQIWIRNLPNKVNPGGSGSTTLYFIVQAEHTRASQLSKIFRHYMYIRPNSENVFLEVCLCRRNANECFCSYCWLCWVWFYLSRFEVFENKFQRPSLLYTPTQGTLIPLIVWEPAGVGEGWKNTREERGSDVGQIHRKEREFSITSSTNKE